MYNNDLYNDSALFSTFHNTGVSGVISFNDSTVLNRFHIYFCNFNYELDKHDFCGTVDYLGREL